MSLRLIKPDVTMESDVMEYRTEFMDEGKSFIEGATGLAEANDYRSWYEYIKQNEKEETVIQGFVPASTWLAYTDDTLVGIINVRHRLNDYLLHYAGHIGYSIRASQRRKGYGKEMLRQTLSFCDDLQINPVLITCNIHNIGSRKTIIANGGVLENEECFEDEVMQRYWITRLS